jgi:hypothetical protein
MIGGEFLSLLPDETFGLGKVAGMHIDFPSGQRLPI